MNLTVLNVLLTIKSPPVIINTSVSVKSVVPGIMFFFLFTFKVVFNLTLMKFAIWLTDHIVYFIVTYYNGINISVPTHNGTKKPRT